MKIPTILAISLAVLGFAAPAHATPSTYQVTGPVLEVTDTKIVIQKGKEQWDIARTAGTQVTGNLKVGSKVTIQYTMTAETIAVKAEKPAKTEKPIPAVKQPKPATEAKPAKPAKAAKPAEAPAAPVKKAA
jgi:hypothetical protein